MLELIFPSIIFHSVMYRYTENLSGSKTIKYYIILLREYTENDRKIYAKFMLPLDYRPYMYHYVYYFIGYSNIVDKIFFVRSNPIELHSDSIVFEYEEQMVNYFPISRPIEFTINSSYLIEIDYNHIIKEILKNNKYCEQIPKDWKQWFVENF